MDTGIKSVEDGSLVDINIVLVADGVVGLGDVVVSGIKQINILLAVRLTI